MNKKPLLKTFLILFFLFGLFINISNADVQNIKIDYCENEGKINQDDSKLINVQPGGQEEICLNITSGEPEEVRLVYGFTEGFVSERGNQLCNIELEKENSFSKLFTNDNGNVRNFLIKPGETKTIKEKINVPIGMSGMIYGCMLHKIEAQEQTKKMFKIVALVKRHLNLFVGGNSEIKNSIKILKTDGNVFSSNNKIGATIEDNRISLNFLLKNDGNVDQNIKIEGTISNALGLEKTFEIATVLVGPGSEKKLTSDTILLPTYKGLFNVYSKISSEPVFAFNADNLDPEIKKGSVIEEASKIFIFSRIRVVIGIILILILIMIFRPLFRKHHQS